MTPTPGSPKPHVLRCGRCGRFVDWSEARFQVVCGCRPHLDLPPVLTRTATEADRPVVLALLRREFGLETVVAFDEVLDLAPLDTVVAAMHGEIGGVLAYRRAGTVLQIVALATDPMWQRAGVGGHLLAEIESIARQERLSRIYVSVSNDNIPALYFYQRHGYRIASIVPGVFERRADAAPSRGFAGIRPQDELRLEKAL